MSGNSPTDPIMSDSVRSLRLRGSARRRRRGAHLVEFAMVLPLLVLMLSGSIEMARINMIRNTAQNAAYEGARRGALPGAKTADARSAAQQVLNATSLKKGTVTITPSVITDRVPQVTVTVMVPMNSNLWITPLFSKNASISATCTLSRELVLP